MSGLEGNALPAIALLLLVLATDLWIFVEARTRQAEGRAVIATVGPVSISTPAQWLLGCLVLWVLVVPLYLVARNA